MLSYKEKGVLMTVTLYSTHCPQCRIIEQKLSKKNINYQCIDKLEDVVEFGQKHDIKSAPILDVDGEVMSFKQANTWINNFSEAD